MQHFKLARNAFYEVVGYFVRGSEVVFLADSELIWILVNCKACGSMCYAGSCGDEII